MAARASGPAIFNFFWGAPNLSLGSKDVPKSNLRMRRGRLLNMGHGKPCPDNYFPAQLRIRDMG